MKRTLNLTTPHMKGPDVEFAQRLLTKHGDYDGPINGEYDVITAQASNRAQFRLGYAKPSQGFGTPLEKLLTGVAKPTVAMNNSFQTIEGNISDTCARHQRSLDSSFAKRYVFVRVSK